MRKRRKRLFSLPEYSDTDETDEEAEGMRLASDGEDIDNSVNDDKVDDGRKVAEDNDKEDMRSFVASDDNSVEEMSDNEAEEEKVFEGSDSDIEDDEAEQEWRFERRTCAT